LPFEDHSHEDSEGDRCSHQGTHHGAGRPEDPMSHDSARSGTCDQARETEYPGGPPTERGGVRLHPETAAQDLGDAVEFRDVRPDLRHARSPLTRVWN